MAKGEFCCSENVIHEGAVAEVREKMHSCLLYTSDAADE